MKKILSFIFMAVFLFSIASSYSENIDKEAKNLINNKIDCSSLSEAQLEVLGEYYMEQMNPGEAHVYMDNIIGGEGSSNLKLAHISMGKAFYCGDYSAMGPWMMYGNFGDLSEDDFRNANMGRGMGPWMMYGVGDNVMGGSGDFSDYSNYGMMGGYGYGGGMFFGWIIGILVITALILFIIWLYKQIWEK